MINHKIQKSSGFTIMELIVVIALSSGVFAIAAGVFVQAIKMQRRAFFIQKVQENIGFALESMAKEIRVSSISTGNTTCPSAPAQSLSINHPVNGNIDYFLSGTDLHRRLPGPGIDTVVNSIGTQINRMGFCISGNFADDKIQPRVTILLTVSNGHPNPDQNISIDIQTTVSQRLLSD
ncbi:MAG: type II secretion system protein [bacterium]|nr:type II secretion system protein [bacterium]